MSFLYLALDLFAISIPLAFSFYSRVNFSKTWDRLFLSIVIPAIIFIAWDVLFTYWGVWGFNPAYLTGIDIINLPLEEWLFFICIPFACVFTYFALKHLVKRDWFANATPMINWALVIVLTVVAILNLDKAYTATTFLSLSVFILIHVFILKSDYLGRFYFAYLFILIPFFLINGVLTGSGIEDQVVWYDNTENLGIRMGTIPVEDTLYGMLLIMMNVTVFEEIKRKKPSQTLQ